MNWYELLVLCIAAFFGGYAFIWAIPGIIFGAVLGLGDPQRMVFIDKQLSKNVTKLHSNTGCMMSYSIINRFLGYSLIYPFIRHRTVTDSVKFRVFMWINCLGFWSWIITPILVSILKSMGVGQH